MFQFRAELSAKLVGFYTFFSLDESLMMNSTFLSLHVNLLSMTSNTGSLQNAKG